MAGQNGWTVSLTFATELSRLLLVHRLTRKAVAERIGVRPETIRRLALGASNPQLDTADRLAVLFNSERLVELALEPRRSICPTCQRGFVTLSKTRGRRRFCSKKCQSAARNRVEAERRASPYRVAANRLREAQAAIARFCNDCTTGEGLCRDSGCALRSVSPLPFVPLSAISRRRVA